MVAVEVRVLGADTLNKLRFDHKQTPFGVNGQDQTSIGQLNPKENDLARLLLPRPSFMFKNKAPTVLSPPSEGVLAFDP